MTKPTGTKPRTKPKRPGTHRPSTPEQGGPLAVPEHLGAVGRRLWTETQAAYSIADGPGRRLLLTACESADLAEQCRLRLGREGLTVATAQGRRAHPLLAVQRDAKNALLAALRGLDLEV